MGAWVEYIGIVAAFCTTIAFLPQAIQTIRTRHTDDISLSMYIILIIGLSLWLIYGLAINNIPIILANTFTLLLSGVILFIKVQNEWRRK